MAHSGLADPPQTMPELRSQLDELAAELRARTAERDEALEQQTATAEVLQVINSSPGNLTPVFDAIVEKAHALCDAAYGSLQLWDGEMFRGVAMRGFPPAMIEALRRGYSPGPNHPCRLLLDGKRIAHCADMAVVDDPVTREGAKLSGIRTVLYVALRKDDTLLGQIVAGRQEVRPFTAKEIALVENFAAQAVIAIENARLINETREALEQQTATAEVLQVINSSRGDLAPVFDAILEKAHRLCEAPCGSLQIFDGKRLRAVATRGMPEAFTALLRRGFYPSANRNEVVQGDFVELGRAPDNQVARAAAEIAGLRAMVAVPLQKDSALLGRIVAARRDIHPFTNRQIALLQNFADQAVIAMENARLITETREALEQQTATAEVLQVINSSPGDLAPVFDAMLEKAVRLCDGVNGILWTFEGKRARLAASRNMLPAAVELLRRQGESGSHPMVQRVIAGDYLFQFDSAENEAYRSGEIAAAATVIASGVRTVIWVALVKDGAAVGAFVISRQEVRPFSDKQIALLQNFAAQAVIAMENARLITETREALEQQTATAEVLQVINSSPGDLVPVFDAMLDKALGLCGAAFGVLWTYDGERVRTAALRGAPPEFAEFLTRAPHPVGPDNAHGRLLGGEPVVHIVDVLEDRAYLSGDPTRRSLVELGGGRTLLAVPLRKDDTFLGDFVIYRQEVRPFCDKQIALLENFAAQAVIAIENARLLGELRQRTRDLAESLEYQTATSDVLRVISGSVFDLEPVLKTVVSIAIRLCRADQAVIYRNFDSEYRWAAGNSLAPEYERIEREVRIRPGTGTLVGRAALYAQTVHILDAWTDPLYEAKDDACIGGIRTMLGVPLLRDGQPIGVIGLARRRVEPYTDKEIELVRTFADQAVIAIENTRLLTELRESLEQQHAIAEILQVINSSPGDLAPVFDAILDKTHGLCGASRGTLFLFDGERFRAAASQGYPGGPPPRMLQGIHVSEDPRLAALLAGERPIHVPDLSKLEDPIARAVAQRGGVRTNLLLPLRKDDALLGVLSCNRTEVNPFTDKQIALLQNFAAQAVIAMDNARLLDEIRQRQAELRVTFDNMGDGVAMFDPELRLAAWNRNFQEILDLPDEFVAERPKFDEYFRYLAERGEYASSDLEAELKSRLDDPEQQLRFERPRPDGRVIEVRRNPVPSGGFVMIYSDVTARKRAEAEIRDARDAAEKALAELKAAQASLIHAEKMASLGQLTAGIAHEIKNPLNFVNNFAGLSVELLDELKEMAEPGIATLGKDTRAEIDETIHMLTGNLDRIAEHGRRADGIVQSMLAHSRGTSGERQQVDVNALVDEALNLAYHGARALDQSFNITLERDFEPAIPAVELVPQDMMRVFINLISNGFHAAQQREKELGDPHFRPLLKVTTRDLGDAVELRVRDNGIGIKPEHRDKLFQPFFTTKPTGEGTGLGLSISYDIVTQQHGGMINVDSEPGVFTEFTVLLPRSLSERSK